MGMIRTASAIVKEPAQEAIFRKASGFQAKIPTLYYRLKPSRAFTSLTFLVRISHMIYAKHRTIAMLHPSLPR